MLSLKQLLTPPTEDEALASILSILTQLGLQTTSWQTGSAQLLILRLFARVWALIGSTVTTIAAGGFTTLATGVWLRMLAKYFYNFDAIPAQNTIGKVLLTSSAGAPIHTWAAGDIIIANAEQGEDGAVSFTCTEGGSLAPGASIVIEFIADVAGDAGNIVPDTSLFLWTPLVGVTATNPPLLPDSNTWITTPGQDEESDERLLQRCLARWAFLTYGNMDGAYVGWALEALPALTRVGVANSAGNGTVTIYGATALGPLTAPQCTTIQDYINGVTDGIGRRPINDIVTVLPAVLVSTPALTVTAYVVSQYIVAAPPVIESKLLTYIGKQPLGGVVLQGTQGRILYDDLLDTAKRATDGVRSVRLNITDDVLLNEGEFYAPTVTVNPLPVAPGANT